jgi:hypothetical protein
LVRISAERKKVPAKSKKGLKKDGPIVKFLWVLTCNCRHPSILEYEGATSTIDLWGWRNQILASHLLHLSLLIYFLCSICQLHLQDFMLFHRPPIMFCCRICHHRIRVRNH